jgi:hypothetical protein
LVEALAKWNTAWNRHTLRAGVCLALFVAARPELQGQMAVPSAQVAQAAGRIHGVVMDVDGDVVSGARVALTPVGSTESRETTTDEAGRFEFDGVAAGKFKLYATADEMKPGMFLGEVHAGEEVATPPIRLDLDAVESSVQVYASREELAAAEVKLEEHQRIGGVLPNFFVTYDWHAPPITSKQKLELSWRNVIDPVNLVVDAGIAGIQQANDDLSGYGYGAAGYGKRVAANTGDLMFGTFMGGAVFPILFHQDPRYFYKGTGGVVKRALYATAAAVICRGDNGKWQPNYSSVLGDLAAGALSNLYYPKANRDGLTLTFENGLLATAFDAVGNLVQEFVFKRVTPHSPVYGSIGKQPK